MAVYLRNIYLGFQHSCLVSVLNRQLEFQDGHPVYFYPDRFTNDFERKAYITKAELIAYLSSSQDIHLGFSGGFSTWVWGTCFLSVSDQFTCFRLTWRDPHTVRPDEEQKQFEQAQINLGWELKAPYIVTGDEIEESELFLEDGSLEIDLDTGMRGVGRIYVQSDLGGHLSDNCPVINDGSASFGYTHYLPYEVPSEIADALDKRYKPQYFVTPYAPETGYSVSIPQKNRSKLKLLTLIKQVLSGEMSLNKFWPVYSDTYYSVADMTLFERDVRFFDAVDHVADHDLNNLEPIRHLYTTYLEDQD